MEPPVNDHSVSRLVSLGYCDHFASQFSSHAALGLLPARVAAEHRGAYVLLTPEGEVSAHLAGRFRHTAASRRQWPAVGDWVAFRAAGGGPESGMNIHSALTHHVIHAVLPRRTAFLRAVAGGLSEPQVVAANVDVILIVCALGPDLNLRRIERYLAAARASGAEPGIALTKADLFDDGAVAAAEVRAIAGSAPVVLVSSVTGLGRDEVCALTAGSRTMAIVGSSGVGKSTLINRLADEAAQLTASLGADGRGRHTTTHRELFALPGGGMVLDTPGMRELRLWDADDGVAETFDDVTALAARCRFGDCAHESEPGCAVLAALEDGTLSPSRWGSWVKLQRELHALARRTDARLAAEDKRQIKVFSRAARVRDRGRR